LDANPSVLDELIDDEELIGRVFAAYQAKRAPPEDNAVDVEADQDAPS
jgi:hypothetical protein